YIVLDTEVDENGDPEPKRYFRFTVTGETGFEQTYKIYITVQSADTSLDIVKAGETPAAIADAADALDYSRIRTNYNKTASANSNSDIYDTDFDGYFITVDKDAATASVKVKAKDEHAKVAIGPFLTREDFDMMIDDSQNAYVKPAYISSIYADKATADLNGGGAYYSAMTQENAVYSLSNDNRYKAITADPVTINLSEGIFVPIVTMAENGTTTDIKYLLIREDKSDLSLLDDYDNELYGIYVKVYYADGDANGIWEPAEYDDSTGEYNVGIPNNMNNVDIRVQTRRKDVISIIIGDNTPENSTGEWIDKLSLDLSNPPYVSTYMDGTTKTVNRNEGQRVYAEYPLSETGQTTTVPIYVYADNGTIISNELSTDYPLGPIILNLNKKSENTDIAVVTINPDTQYESSDNTERYTTLTSYSQYYARYEDTDNPGDPVNVPSYTIFINEDPTNPETYRENLLITLADAKATLTTLLDTETTYTPDKDGNIRIGPLDLVERDNVSRKVFRIPVRVTAEAGNTKDYILNVELQNLDIDIEEIKYNNKSENIVHDLDSRDYYVFEDAGISSALMYIRSTSGTYMTLLSAADAANDQAYTYTTESNATMNE
ncbi:MAG: hypothetical protein IJH17_00475, partial [Clostridia bacterium]|nr:hypothetical protein [Clostridia bacterium]